MVRSLVAMTTSNKATYWIVNQSGSIESGQTLTRRAGKNAPEVLLSDSTVLPVQVSDEVPQAVADELNKAIRKEAQPAQPKAGAARVQTVPPPHAPAPRSCVAARARPIYFFVTL